ncbi:hypothetical protein ES332_A04G064200v1 [Gossypium tomentosum]|uniref:Uncharacterized protein n=1 Tax=Gossypium tomentosum TaxID=34277 RepID=A0A5D2QUY0_GOSTO|nr:hypothetical protein ES332_A04G064200v1 [Gossypium tomentosum]
MNFKKLTAAEPLSCLVADGARIVVRSCQRRPRPCRSSKVKKNSTPFDPRPHLHTSKIFGLSSASIQVWRPVGVVVRGIWRRAYGGRLCRSYSVEGWGLAAAQEVETLGFLFLKYFGPFGLMQFWV